MNWRLLIFLKRDDKVVFISAFGKLYIGNARVRKYLHYHYIHECLVASTIHIQDLDVAGRKQFFFLLRSRLQSISGVSFSVMLCTYSSAVLRVFASGRLNVCIDSGNSRWDSSGERLCTEQDRVGISAISNKFRICPEWVGGPVIVQWGLRGGKRGGGDGMAMLKVNCLFVFDGEKRNLGDFLKRPLGDWGDIYCKTLWGVVLLL